MTAGDDRRSRLAARQAELVKALAAGGEVPPHFDSERVRIAAVALTHKRLRSIAQAWPRLARSLGPSLEARFRNYTELNPSSPPGGPRADGRAFARWLASRAELPDAGRREALAADLHHVFRRGDTFPRRGPTLRSVWLPQAGRLLVAFHWPRLGGRWIELPVRPRRPCPDADDTLSGPLRSEAE